MQTHLSRDDQTPAGTWLPGSTPVAVIMISRNEAHNMETVLLNLAGWAQEVFLVDSRSADDTVDIALRHGVHVVQRSFRSFGDQWNFALETLPITAPWTMKLDPDERLSDALKDSINQLTRGDNTAEGIAVRLRLWFMGKALPVHMHQMRVWRTGRCRFTHVAVNEYAQVSGLVLDAHGDLEHHDSPDLQHWMAKQNRYTTAEAARRFQGQPLAAQARLLGSPLERRMWLKHHFWKIPGRYSLLFVYHLLAIGSWRAGRVGWIWARLRTEVYRMWEYKEYEMRLLGRVPTKIPDHLGLPDPRVSQYD